MRRVRFLPLLLCLLALPLEARVYRVTPADGSLQEAITRAEPGATLILAAGVYPGPVVIDRPLHLTADLSTEGQVIGHAIIDGGQRVITVAAPDVTLSHLKIINSGTSLATEDSGIFVTAKGARALLRDNWLAHNLIGIYLKGPIDARVINNRIFGRDDLRMSEAGNGIHLWNTPGSVVEGNEVTGGRDGIFVTTSRNNIFRDNQLKNLRFAIHYMYTHMSRVEGNLSVNNHIGYTLMYSSHLEVHHNISRNDRDRGLILNYTNDSTLTNNQVLGQGLAANTEKCLFIYNAHFNRIEQNDFQGCAIGVHFTAGSEGNSISRNSFENNRQQVKYVGTRWLEWSKDGVGNYWSDHWAYDRNEDGLADRHYQPNSLADQILWRHKAAKILLNSPALQLLRLAQARFPALHPGGVVDSAPLMAKP